jgi:hypothetical protein
LDQDPASGIEAQSVTNHQPAERDADRRRPPLYLDPRVLRLAIVTTVIIIASLLASRLQMALLLPGAFAVAVAADVLEPFDTEWIGWRRSVDRTRVLLFIGWLLVAFAGLWLIGYVVDNHVFLCC